MSLPFSYFYLPALWYSEFNQELLNYFVLGKTQIDFHIHSIDYKPKSNHSVKIPMTSVQFRSVSQSCLILCYPMNHSMPGLPVHHQLWSLLKLMSIESVMPSSHLILCRPLLLPPPVPPSIKVFPMSQLFK